MLLAVVMWSAFGLQTPASWVAMFAQRYMPSFRLGTMIAMALPLAAAFYVSGMLLTAVWVALGIPVGPAAPVEYHVPGLVN